MIRSDIARILAEGRIGYLALPGQVVLVVSAAVQRDQEVGARVSVSDGKAGVGHFLARGGCEEKTGSALPAQLSGTKM